MTIERAEKLYRDFFGEEPPVTSIVKIATRPNFAVEIGRLDGIIYRTKDEKTPLIHRFSRSRPFLFVSSDGSQIYIVKGQYRFTSRGFVG